MSNTFTIVQESLIKAGIPSQEIRVDATLRDDLSIDSLELIEVVEAIEKQIGLSIEMRELRNIQTVAELITFVDNYPNQHAR